MKQTNIALGQCNRSDNRKRRPAVLAAVLAALVTTLAAPEAGAQIKQPGAHPKYSVELEPHFLLWWTGGHGWSGAGYYDANTGWGLGGRATIPFLDNGPIPTINNNMGITFGFDWGHWGGRCRWGGWYGPRDPRYYSDCSSDEFWFPVALQWNFFITKAFSAFGEPGLAIRHTRWSGTYYCVDPVYGGGYGVCDAPSQTGPEPYFAVGGRVHFSDKASFTFRLGWPYLSLGASFFL
jgi:hypothetical protein